MLSAEDNLDRGPAFVHGLELQRARSLRRATWTYATAALAATLWLAFTLFRVQSANTQLGATQKLLLGVEENLSARQTQLDRAQQEATRLETQLVQKRSETESLDERLKAKQQALDEVEKALTSYDKREQTAVGKAVSSIVKLGATDKGY
jgi:septal ring factor EnvC (AmiA/AmiB activator)